MKKIVVKDFRAVSAFNKTLREMYFSFQEETHSLVQGRDIMLAEVQYFEERFNILRKIEKATDCDMFHGKTVEYSRDDSCLEEIKKLLIEEKKIIGVKHSECEKEIAPMKNLQGEIKPGYNQVLQSSDNNASDKQPQYCDRRFFAATLKIGFKSHKALVLENALLKKECWKLKKKLNELGKQIEISYKQLDWFKKGCQHFMESAYCRIESINPKTYSYTYRKEIEVGSVVQLKHLVDDNFKLGEECEESLRKMTSL